MDLRLADPGAAAALLRTRDPRAEAAGADAARDPSRLGPAFEAMLLREVVKAMRATVPEGGALSGVTGRQVYDAMIEDALADHLARDGGIGLSRLFDPARVPPRPDRERIFAAPEIRESLRDGDAGALRDHLPPDEDPWLDSPEAFLRLRALLEPAPDGDDRR
jgi:hypothetical protein